MWVTGITLLLTVLGLVTAEIFRSRAHVQVGFSLDMLALFGLGTAGHGGDEHHYSREELRLIVHAKHASRAGEEYSMMQHALDLPELVVGDVLRTRDQLAAFRDGMRSSSRCSTRSGSVRCRARTCVCLRSERKAPPDRVCICNKPA